MIKKQEKNNMKVINRKHWDVIYKMAICGWEWDTDINISCRLEMDDRFPVLRIFKKDVVFGGRNVKTVPFDAVFKHRHAEMMFVTEQVYEYLRIGCDKWIQEKFKRIPKL